MPSSGRGAGKLKRAVDAAKSEGGAIVCSSETNAKAVSRIHGGRVTTWKSAHYDGTLTSTWVVDFPGEATDTKQGPTEGDDHG